MKLIYSNFFFSIFMILLLLESSFSAGKKETTEQEDVLGEFKESKFLQVDQLNIPKELSRIEAQIKQNALDVILSSKTHTPVYAQKLEKGYTENYKKFFGVQIQITPIANEEDFYNLKYTYYNWTTRKFDKTLQRKISKYNVLNEMRFGLYELLLGKKFVDDHKDEIEKENYNRILAVRESEEANAVQKRKQKKNEKIKNEEKLQKLSVEEKKRSLLTRGKGEQKDKKKKKDKNDEGSTESGTTSNTLKDNNESSETQLLAPNVPKEEKEKNKDNKKTKLDKKAKPVEIVPETPEALPASADIPPPDVGDNISSVSRLYAFANYFNENVTSEGYLHASTNLKYVGFGARYIQEQETARPRGLRFSLKVGLPLQKDNYAFPVYRSFETEIYKRKILNHFQLLAGLDLSPIYFVNLANPGEGLKVFENDVFWAKAGISYNQEIFGKEIDLRALYLKSVMVKNNVKKDLSGTSIVLNAYYQQTNKHGVEFSSQTKIFSGDLKVTSRNIYFSYVYKFEN